MRAKLVENTTNFKRGNDVKSALSIGSAHKAKQKLEKMYDNHFYLTYEFISVDKIIIKMKEKHINRFNPKDEENQNLPAYIIKYSVLPPYFSAPYEKKGDTWIDENTTYKYWSVWHRYFNQSYDPDHMKINDEREIDISDTRKEGEAKLKTELIADAFNAEFGPVSGFELVESFIFTLSEYKEGIKKL